MYWGAMAGHMGWGIIEEEGWRKGPWTSEEDRLLIEYVRLHGEGRWNSVARLAGLKRNGKSCRLRWVNYLRPDLKRGQITPHEESIILELHARWGNRQEMSSVAFPQTVDEQNFLYTMLNVNNNVSAVPEAQAINEDILWDGLWNLDDFHGNGMNFNANCSNGKANTLHNLVVPFC
ncbi:hypothetical protein F8388_003256 [Cannabis sativa]|uniref:Uncharacterized protein n=1 Tax=Cannabis sativa TaxID=3483 RepID=A0A7J6DZL6_CANSA|nr:hypothetical protein F8388_003256 [Cannabis sativa]KAF4370940.1 hypothetical protein G4B88_012740 [Cannabis sativa]